MHGGLGIELLKVVDEGLVDLIVLQHRPKFVMGYGVEGTLQVKKHHVELSICGNVLSEVVDDLNVVSGSRDLSEESFLDALVDDLVLAQMSEHFCLEDGMEDLGHSTSD